MTVGSCLVAKPLRRLQGVSKALAQGLGWKGEGGR
jgi:hypothetical protein